MKLRFVQDDSCHWYAIPAEKDEEFYKWVGSFQEDVDTWSGTDFGQYRIDGYPGFYTFTDLAKG